MLKHTNLIVIISLVLFSCQKTELYNEIIFDNSQLTGIGINAEKKEIYISYDSLLNDPYIDHVMQTRPVKRIESWIEDNINNFGTMNNLIIDIVEASVTRNEIETEEKVAGVVRNKIEYLYEINIVLAFVLYNDENKVLATTKVEVYRSTTSSKFISLNERNNILDSLSLEALIDLSDKTGELLKIHMSEYVL